MPGDDDDRELFDDEHPGPQVLESALANTALSEVVSQPPLMVAPSTTLADTIHLMQQERRACVLVMENDRLAGIFTERDILMKVAGQPLDLIHTPVSASMTPDPFTLPAGTPLVLSPGSTLSVDAARVDLLSSITDPAGKLNFQNAFTL